MIFRQLFDRTSCTYTYLLGDVDRGEAILIDPVFAQVDRDLTLLRELGLDLIATVETHVHADHVTAASVLRERTGCDIVVPKGGGVSGATRQVGAGDTIDVGGHTLDVRPTPGHTVSCTTYVDQEGERVFTGDTLFIRGCGRTDFQGGDARTLYRSVYGQIFALPDTFRIYPGHDYKGRTMSTVAEERVWNPRLGGGRTEDAFVALMDDLDLSDPERMDVAVPANLEVGRDAVS